jgi:integral membrane protein (TIGR00529 family)
MIEWLINLPALVKTGAVFAGILLVYRFGVSLGISIIIHSLILTLISGAGAEGLLLQVKCLGNPENWLLIIVILLILSFTESLKNTGRMDRTLSALKQWLNNHNLLLGGLPALIGILPMPGGAMFSAPFINSLDKDQKIEPALKTAINYWFRHIWEFCWPLYPAVIFAIHYSRLSSGTFIILLLPLSFAAVIGGYIFMIRRVQKLNTSSPKTTFDKNAIGDTFLPIIIIVATAICGSALLQGLHFKRIHANLSAMLLGLILSILILLIKDPKKVYHSIKTIKSKKTFLLILVIIGIQSFSATLTASIDNAGSTLVSSMRDEMISMGIPIILVIVFVPLISGIVTGVGFAFVGASFPIVFALLGPSPGFNVLASATTLAYASGYIGMILSPLHVCFVITAEYFKTSIFKVYPFLIGPIAFVFLVAVILSGLYYLLF